MTDLLDDSSIDDEGPRRLGVFIAVPVIVVLVAFIAVLATSEPSTDRRAGSELLGQVAPVITGETLDGEQFTLADTRGEFVVVNFFATWCTPCIREHPELVAFEARHRQLGDALVVSVLYDDSPSDARALFDELGGDWPVVIDPDSRFALDFGVVRMPESYLLDPNGVVVQKFIGGVTAEALETALARFQGSSS